MRAESPTPVTRLELETWVLGRLDPDRAAALEAMGAADPELQARMDRVRGEIERAAVDMPTLELPEEDEVPARAGWRAWLRGPLLGGLALAGAAAIALLVVLPPDDPVESGAWRGGGVMDLELVRMRMGEAQPQGVLVQAQEGDRLQFSVAAPDAGWLQVYDFQDDGLVQAWLEPTQVAAKQPVERAVLLDDYDGSERVFFLISPDPIPLERAQQAGEQIFNRPLAELDRLPGFGREVIQRSVLIVKEPQQ